MIMGKTTHIKKIKPAKTDKTKKGFDRPPTDGCLPIK